MIRGLFKRLPAFFRSSPVRTKLIISYFIILGMGGLVTSIVGSYIVSGTIMKEARLRVRHDLDIARSVYDAQSSAAVSALRDAASGTTIQRFLRAGDRSSILAYLRQVQEESGLDFLSLTDGAGSVVLRAGNPSLGGDDMSRMPLVRAALSGKLVSSTEILPAGDVRAENPGLYERAHLAPAGPPGTRTGGEASGMAVMAAAPVREPGRGIVGVLYGGTLLNRSLTVVDRAWDLLYVGETYGGRDIGAVTVFQDDRRIATTLKTDDGRRNIGSRSSPGIRDAVFDRGEKWFGRAFLVDDWYISGYEPIRNYRGEIIGMLGVGLLENAYTSIRDRVIIAFFIIATSGFILIIVVTYLLIKGITRPLDDMVAATKRIAAGQLDIEVDASYQDEIGQLAGSFNSMLQSIRQKNAKIEEWTRTLEEKVEQRTRELMAMQKQVERTERMAYLGRLAAGIAHEINNPLGGIMALTGLVLEDLEAADSRRGALEEVIKQSQRCRDIVKGLLEFSRQTEPKTETVDVHTVLNTTLSLLEKQSMFFNIKVVKDYDERLPHVLGDPSQLQQVFMNVILNGVQAMNEVGTLGLTTRATDGTGTVEIEISDTGCGIPPQIIDRIFDPFFTTKESGGTGLGLSIAYGIVTNHGGAMAVKSRVGGGTQFLIRLPAAYEA